MFLTQEDPRASIKGSRDPLGVQPIWSSFGRHIVTNLTTVTNSVRGFTVVILARYLTEQLIERGQISEDDALPVFLRMEQVAAYVRHVGHGIDSDILGIQRVQSNVAKDKRRVWIQDDANGMILADQRTNGLWGLYSVAARASGLITEGPVGITDETRAFVDAVYMRWLDPVKEELLKLLAKGGYCSIDQRSALLRALKHVFTPRLNSKEIAFYSAALRDARNGRDQVLADRQEAFVRLLIEYGDWGQETIYVSREEVELISAQAAKVNEGLAIRLQHILRLESFLAVAEYLFEYMQMCSNQDLNQIAGRVTQIWSKRLPILDRASFDRIKSDIAAATNNELTSIIEGCDRDLESGDYVGAMHALLKINRMVMERRGAAPWIQLAGDKIDVLYKGSDFVLQSPPIWRNSYFLHSLKQVTAQLGERS